MNDYTQCWADGALMEIQFTAEPSVIDPHIVWCKFWFC